MVVVVVVGRAWGLRRRREVAEEEVVVEGVAAGHRAASSMGVVLDLRPWGKWTRCPRSSLCSQRVSREKVGEEGEEGEGEVEGDEVGPVVVGSNWGKRGTRTWKRMVSPLNPDTFAGAHKGGPPLGEAMNTSSGVPRERRE